MPKPILKLPTLDTQVPRDAVVAFELLRRAHETVQMQLAELETKIAQAATVTPAQIQRISDELSSGGMAPVTVEGGAGSLPPSPRDPTVYLNGEALPRFAHVQDAHIRVADITTNNASTAAHGFMPKLSGNPNEVLNGAGEWMSSAAGMGGLWAPVTNGDPLSPEILFDSNGEVIMGNEPDALLS